MKLKDTFITHNLEDTQVMVNASGDKNAFHGLIKSNPTASFIIEHMKEDTTVEKLVEALLNEYDVDEPTAKKAVEYVVSKLKEVDAIED